MGDGLGYPSFALTRQGVETGGMCHFTSLFEHDALWFRQFLFCVNRCFEDMGKLRRLLLSGSAVFDFCISQACIQNIFQRRSFFNFPIISL